MKVRWSSDAEDDRDEIREHIATDNPRAAIRIDELIGSAVARLADFPHSGRPGLLADTREIFPHRHYRLVYAVQDDAIWIMAILHTSRQWPPAPDNFEDETD